MLDGENDQNPGVNPGDVIFKIKTQPHPLFVRRGNDLHYKTTITLLEVCSAKRIFLLRYLKR